MRKYIYLILPIVLVLTVCYFSETNIHIIRHGEKVIAEGVSDAPLTDKGILQAKEVGERLKDLKISQIYASPMRRARQTAVNISSITNSEIIYDARLTEKNYRKSEELYPDGTNIYVKYLPDGTKETKEQHLKRLQLFLKEKISIFDKELWIVAHGGLIQRLLEKIQQVKVQELPALKIKYCSDFEFRYNKFTGHVRYVNHTYIPSLQSKTK